MKLSFFQSNKSQWTNLQIELSDAISTFLKCGKDFEIEFKEMSDSKTYQQLRGIHRLASLLAVRLTETSGVKYSMENAKDWIKWEFEFVELVSEEEALAEAINERNKAKQLGVKMVKAQFLRLVESFKLSLKKPRSFASAKKEEMIELIEKIEELGRKMGWEELRLTSAEKQALLDYYQKEV